MTRITAPAPPRPAPEFRFPVVASAAPLVVAVALWLVTGSPYSLLFAVLGPVTAVASLVDSRWGAHRGHRAESARYTEEEARARTAIEAAHAEERAALGERTPGIAALLLRSGADPWRWTVSGPEVPVAVGTGSVPSGVTVEGESAALAESASLLTGAPVVVDASFGIGVCGPAVLATAVARAITVQVAWALSPAMYSCRGSEPWLSALPHAVDRMPRAGVLVEFGVRGERAPLVTIATAEREAQLPGECRVVLRVGAGGAAIVSHPDRSRRGAVRPGAVGAEAARTWAEGIAAEAQRDGIVAATSALPEVVPLADLAHGPAGASGLACAVGRDAGGPVVIDLVADGPHAVVGGTTGSGKSELLVSWVVAMAAAHPPSRFTVLLVDFKGGAAFAPLAGLPHTVGIVTDLDEEQADRALASLRAELRHRERALAEVGARDIESGRALPRLVIVVDEFAAMTASHPDLHALFADIAARGRSLGVHLVLCTQRPAGVVRDGVLANAHLRISLRVNNRADSSAVVGTDAAAELPARARGRGILVTPDAAPSTVQFALADAGDVERAASLWPEAPPPRRPWCEPLPARVSPAEASGGFGLLDLPEEQRRSVATWSPAADGHILVLGAARSGVTTALAALAPGAIVLPTALAAAWDVLEAGPPGVLVIDDADSLLARFPVDYRGAVVERLVGLLRDGPARGTYLALGARRITAELQPLVPLVPARLMLAHPSRQEWVLAGGEGAQFRQGLPAGAGVWRGHRVQVVDVTVPTPEPASARIGEIDPGRPRAVVTTRAGHLLARGGRSLADTDPAALRPGDILVGDVEEWQSRWGALAAARECADVLFDRCTPADVRALTRSRELPPVLAGLEGAAWRLEPDGRLSRVRFDP